MFNQRLAPLIWALIFSQSSWAIKKDLLPSGNCAVEYKGLAEKAYQWKPFERQRGELFRQHVLSSPHATARFLMEWKIAPKTLSKLLGARSGDWQSYLADPDHLFWQKNQMKIKDLFFETLPMNATDLVDANYIGPKGKDRVAMLEKYNLRTPEDYKAHMERAKLWAPEAETAGQLLTHLRKTVGIPRKHIALYLGGTEQRIARWEAKPGLIPDYYIGILEELGTAWTNGNQQSRMKLLDMRQDTYEISFGNDTFDAFSRAIRENPGEHAAIGKHAGLSKEASLSSAQLVAYLLDQGATTTRLGPYLGVNADRVQGWQKGQYIPSNESKKLIALYEEFRKDPNFLVKEDLVAGEVKKLQGLSGTAKLDSNQRRLEVEKLRRRHASIGSWNHALDLAIKIWGRERIAAASTVPYTRVAHSRGPAEDADPRLISLVSQGIHAHMDGDLGRLAELGLYSKDPRDPYRAFLREQDSLRVLAKRIHSFPSTSAAVTSPSLSFKYMGSKKLFTWIKEHAFSVQSMANYCGYDPSNFSKIIDSNSGALPDAIIAKLLELYWITKSKSPDEIAKMDFLGNADKRRYKKGDFPKTPTRLPLTQNKPSAPLAQLQAIVGRTPSPGSGRLKHAQIAQVLGVSTSSVYKYADGSTNIDPKKATRISELFDHFFHGDTDELKRLGVFDNDQSAQDFDQYMKLLDPMPKWADQITRPEQIHGLLGRGNAPRGLKLSAAESKMLLNWREDNRAPSAALIKKLRDYFLSLDEVQQRSLYDDYLQRYQSLGVIRPLDSIQESIRQAHKQGESLELAPTQMRLKELFQWGVSNRLIAKMCNTTHNRPTMWRSAKPQSVPSMEDSYRIYLLHKSIKAGDVTAVAKVLDIPEFEAGLLIDQITWYL